MSILICYDGSASAQHSLTVAQRVLDGQEAVLLHVWNAPERVAADAFSVHDDPKHPSYEQLDEKARRRANEILGDGQRIAEKLGVSVKTMQKCNQSSVPETILRAADELDAELIVTGTHGTTAVESGLLGSVSNELIHNSRRPVLIVPEHAPAT